MTMNSPSQSPDVRPRVTRLCRNSRVVVDRRSGQLLVRWRVPFPPRGLPTPLQDNAMGNEPARVLIVHEHE